MASQIIKPTRAFERNNELTFNLIKYFHAHPSILGRLPSNFELVILPEDDPELTAYNLELLQKYGSEDRPIIFVRMSSANNVNLEEEQPQVYAPIPA